jgi:hypothetical protein
VGAWEVKSEGGLLLRGSKPGEKTHWEEKQTSLVAEAVITKQNGRVIFGIFKSSRANEDFIGVIGLNNSTFHLADTDGFTDGEIISNDRMESIYRHATHNDAVISAGVWTRKQ